MAGVKIDCCVLFVLPALDNIIAQSTYMANMKVSSHF